MKSKCIKVEEYQTWLTLGKIYETDIVTGRPDMIGYIEVKEADDHLPCFVLATQFLSVGNGFQQPSNV